LDFSATFEARCVSTPVSFSFIGLVSGPLFVLVILASANTEGYSPKARLAVTMIEVRS
jgi:hypothetical protein